MIKALLTRWHETGFMPSRDLNSAIYQRTRWKFSARCHRVNRLTITRWQNHVYFHPVTYTRSHAMEKHSIFHPVPHNNPYDHPLCDIPAEDIPIPPKYHKNRPQNVTFRRKPLDHPPKYHKNRVLNVIFRRKYLSPPPKYHIHELSSISHAPVIHPGANGW